MKKWENKWEKNNVYKWKWKKMEKILV
jgi:hypothetical protein